MTARAPGGAWRRAVWSFPLVVALVLPAIGALVSLPAFSVSKYVMRARVEGTRLAAGALASDLALCEADGVDIQEGPHTSYRDACSGAHDVPAGCSASWRHGDGVTAGRVRIECAEGGIVAVARDGERPTVRTREDRFAVGSLLAGGTFLLFVILSVPFWVLFVLSLRPVRLKFVDRRLPTDPASGVGAVGDEAEILPLGSTIALVAATIGVAATAALSMPARWVGSALLVAGVVAGVVGIWLHHRPNVHRRSKYRAFVLSLSWVMLGGAMPTPSGSPSTASGAWVPALLGLGGALVVVLALTSLIANVVITANPTRAYRVLVAPGLTSLMTLAQCFCFPLLLIYFICRYIAVERALARPIVYLRSFGYEHAASAFGRLVAGEAHAWFPIIALVHERQGAFELHADVPLTRHAQTYRVADDVWRQWVQHHLARAAGVVIDVSHASDGVAWEVDAALACVPPARIALLARKGTYPIGASGIALIEYEFGMRTEREARVALRRWCSALPAT